MKSDRGFRWILVFIFAAVVAACNSGDGASTADSSLNGSSARVGVLMTDAPASAGDFAHIYMTVNEVSLLGADGNDAGRVVLFQGNETVDLLNLVNHSEIFALSDTVPAGDYSKIRLTLSQLELVKSDGAGNMQSYFPHLPGNGKIDLNPRGIVHVTAGTTMLVQIDVDAEKSIHIVQKGNKDEYNFRPVIFVDVISADFPGKLVRHTGYVRDLDTAANSFALCDEPATTMEGKNTDQFCLGVNTDNASVFDKDGKPATEGSLANDQKVTAIGFLTAVPLNDTSKVLIYARLGAEVIEIGGPDPWVIEHGAVASAPATATGDFTLQLDNLTSLQARLQDGTKVFSRNGARLDHTAIAAGTEAAVDGVYDATDSGLLYSSLVVIDTGDTLDRISGTIQTIDYGLHRMTVTTANGDMVVQANDDTTIFVITKTGDTTTSTQIQFSALKAAQLVDVYGHVDNGTLHADVVLVEVN